MNKVPNQNGEMLEETLACFISDAVEATLRALQNFRMTLSLLPVLEKPLTSPHSSVSM